MYYNTEIPQLMPFTCGNGDANGDGKLTASDARLVMKSVAGIGKIADENFDKADMNCDKKITASDARIILKKVAGLL
jgi:hypothetical protein